MNETTIIWNGVSIGFKFSMLTFELFCDVMGIEFHQIGETITRKSLKSERILLMSAHEVYTKGEIVLPSNPYEFDDFYSCISKEEKKQIFECMANTMKVFAKPVETSNDEKKK